MIQRDEGLARTSVADDRSGAATSDFGGFDEFFRLAYRDLYGRALSVGANIAQADDLVQVAMYEVSKRWSALERPKAYAWTVIVNELIATRQRESRDTECAKAIARVEAVVVDGGVNAWENVEWVRDLLRKLPPVQRQVLTHVLEGCTSSEIASLLGRSPEAIRKNLQFARERLKIEIQEWVAGDSFGEEV